MSRLIQITLSLFLVLAAISAAAQDKPVTPYIPANTTVAIVPVVNASGEKDSNFRTRQIESGMSYLAKEFTNRGFKLTDPALITRAIGDLKIDMTDEENYNKPTLYKIGMAVNADLIIFALITNVEQHVENKFFSVTMEGRATVKMWLLDVKNQTPNLSAVTKQGKSGGVNWVGEKKGSEEIIRAVANGERDLLKEFFKPYPPMKKPERVETQG